MTEWWYLCHVTVHELRGLSNLPFFSKLATFTQYCPPCCRCVPSMSFSTTRNSSSDASSSQNASDVLKTVQFSRLENTQLPENAVTASDLLLAAYDPAKLHPLADLGDKLDYLLLDDDKTSDLPGAGTAIPSRGWSDDLCYGTGTMYLSGKSGSLSNYSFRVLYARLRPRLLPEHLSPYLNISKPHL